MARGRLSLQVGVVAWSFFAGGWSLTNPPHPLHTPSTPTPMPTHTHRAFSCVFFAVWLLWLWRCDCSLVALRGFVLFPTPTTTPTLIPSHPPPHTPQAARLAPPSAALGQPMPARQHATACGWQTSQSTRRASVASWNASPQTPRNGGCLFEWVCGCWRFVRGFVSPTGCCCVPTGVGHLRASVWGVVSHT